MKIENLFLDFDGVFIRGGQPDRLAVEVIRDLISQHQPQIFLITMWQTWGDKQKQKMYQTLEDLFALTRQNVIETPLEILEKEYEVSNSLHLVFQHPFAANKQAAVRYHIKTQSLTLDTCLVLDDYDLHLPCQPFICDAGQQWIPTLIQLAQLQRTKAE